MTSLQANIKDSRFGIDFFRGFGLVLNGLDNIEARRHVNRLCQAAEVPLVESGTEGYVGQVTACQLVTLCHGWFQQQRLQFLCIHCNMPAAAAACRCCTELPARWAVDAPPDQGRVPGVSADRALVRPYRLGCGGNLRTLGLVCRLP